MDWRSKCKSQRYEASRRYEIWEVSHFIFGNDLLNIKPSRQATKAKPDKWGHIKLKTFFTEGHSQQSER
jgi:hypothetical protein